MMPPLLFSSFFYKTRVSTEAKMPQSFSAEVDSSYNVILSQIGSGQCRFNGHPGGNGV